MSTYLWIGGALLVAGGVFGLLLHWYGEAKEKQGEANVRNEILQEEQKADRRSDEVLAEHRDDNAARGRLQRGDF